jgi:hypothetical protein
MRFLAAHIHSVEQLEILLWMRQTPGEHTAQLVADQLRTTLHSAEERLVDLCGRGLLVAGEGDHYRYEPATAELDATINTLDESYRQAPFAVINIIFSKPVDKIRTFADAFRLRKEDS